MNKLLAPAPVVENPSRASRQNRVAHAAFAGSLLAVVLAASSTFAQSHVPAVRGSRIGDSYTRVSPPAQTSPLQSLTSKLASKPASEQPSQRPPLVLRQPSSIAQAKAPAVRSAAAVGSGVQYANFDEAIESVPARPATPVPQAANSMNQSGPTLLPPENLILGENGSEVFAPGMAAEMVGGYPGAFPMPASATCLPCCAPFCLWVDLRADLLYWYTSGTSLPALVTTSPQGTARDIAGVLGETGTAILFGDNSVNDGGSPGFRAIGDFWFDPSRTYGVQIGYTFLDQQVASFSASSDGDPILARPFLNAVTGLQDANLLAYPDVATGSIDIELKSQLHSANALFRMREFSEPCRFIDLLAGYRFAKLQDTLSINEQMISTDTQSEIVPGTTMAVLDNFDADNTFNGIEIGFTKQRSLLHGLLDFRATVALGNTHSVVTIGGSTTTTVPDDPTPVVSPAGMLALGSNSGQFEHDYFSSISELGVRYQHHLCCGWEASIGYTLIYWSDVVRAGEQIDPELNPTEFPPVGAVEGPAHPTFDFHTTGLLAQGLNLGLEKRF
jgi:hypothetical protein